MGEIIYPAFLADDFLFEGIMPMHRNERPVLPRLPNAYMLAISTPGCLSEELVLIAADVPDIDMLHHLLCARLAKQELTVRSSGRMEDIFMGSPHTEAMLKVYEGSWSGASPEPYDPSYTLIPD